MEQKQIQLGAEYGYREKPKVHSSLEHVRVVERVRGKWRVEWISRTVASETVSLRRTSSYLGRSARDSSQMKRRGRF